MPILALPHARWCKRIAGQRVAVAAAVYWKVERACRLERQRRYFDTATKGRRSENKKVGVDPLGLEQEQRHRREKKTEKNGKGQP